jgi:hypothetical protein
VPQRALVLGQQVGVAVAQLPDQPGRASMSVKTNVTAPLGRSAVTPESIAPKKAAH